MFLGNVKKLVLCSLVAGFAWSMTAPQADAFWHRRGGSSGGSWGSYGSLGRLYSSGGCGVRPAGTGADTTAAVVGLERWLLFQRRQLGLQRWQFGR